MAKRITKYEHVLMEARTRVLTARNQVHVAESVLSQATAALRAHQDAYDALEKALTPTPRKASTKKSASAKAPQDPPADKNAKCGICGNPFNHADHDRAYIKSHDFEPSKPVVRATRKLKQKPEVIPVSDQGVDGNGLAAEMES